MAILTGADTIIGISIFQLILGVYLAIIGIDNHHYDNDFY